MTSESLEKIKTMYTEELDRQLEFGYELGYSEGLKQGTKAAAEQIQCELLFTEMLTEKQIMELFLINEERIKELKEIIKTPKWWLTRYDARDDALNELQSR